MMRRCKDHKSSMSIGIRGKIMPTLARKSVHNAIMIQTALSCSSGHLALLHAESDKTEALILYSNAVQKIGYFTQTSGGHSDGNHSTFRGQPEKALHHARKDIFIMTAIKPSSTSIAVSICKVCRK